MPKTHLLSAAVLTALVLSPAAHAADPEVTADTGTTVQQLDAVSVIGQGETRQVQRITQQDIPVLPPGTSIQKLLNRMPGVNVQSNDAFGANEESQTISLRGFNGTRLGYTLDGLPLGDNAYGNYNGLNISRALIAENFGGVELASGIGALGTASTSNLGGTIQYYSADPSSVFGGQLSQTVGSDANRAPSCAWTPATTTGFRRICPASMPKPPCGRARSRRPPRGSSMPRACTSSMAAS